MSKIPVSDFIAIFEQMKEEKWKYEWGAARKGCVDCSGAFTYAAKKLANISVSHSSNVIPRKNVKELLPISEAKPGYAVFRHSDKFETDALARKYNDGLGNYKHIGLVSRDGKHVLEAKGSKYGFVESKLDNSWYQCGALDFIDYGDEVKEETSNMLVRYRYVSVGENSWLNIRADHGTNKKVIGKLYAGDAVEAVDEYDNWTKIKLSDGSFGWVYSKYLTEGFTVAKDAVTAEEVSKEKDVDFKMAYRLIITDEAGNKFIPVGDFNISVELYTE